MTRCFIGIFVPEGVKNEILKIQDELRKLPIECKFVEPNNLHICLSFLGDIEDEEIDKIRQKLAVIGSSVVKFKSVAHHLKLIPNEKYTRVIVLDVFDEQKMLLLLSKSVVEKIGGDAKPPHITLCRVRNITDKPMFIEKIKDLKINASEFTVDKICLIKSELSRSGPVYSVLYGTPLS